MRPAAMAVPAYCETVQMLACDGERLLAILAEPRSPANGDLGVVIVVGGPQYRAGSHRQFVQLARALAAAGLPVLRFDVRGMGDSSGAQRSFERIAADTGAAIDALLAARPRLRRVALWGLCDGATAALLYLHETADPRVVALCLLNPWVRSDATLAATHVKHYYMQRLLQREFWGKLLRGQVAGQAVSGLLRSVRLMLQPDSNPLPAGHTTGTTPYPQRMAFAWAAFQGQVLLVLSGNDYTAKEFLQTWGTPEWAVARVRPGTHWLDFSEADHTFSQLAHQRALEVGCQHWLQALAGTAVAQAFPSTRT